MPDQGLLVQIASYNTNLQAHRGIPQDLVDWLKPTLQTAAQRRPPDILAVGFQELLPLHQGLAGLSKSVIDNRDSLILSQIEASAPNKEKYSLVAKVVYVGIALLVYALDTGVARRISDVQTQWTGCGPAFLGNKGAVGVRFRVADEGGAGQVYTFVCAHLTAFAHMLEHRIRDYHHIVGTLLFSGPNGPSTIYDTSHLFFFGDLNFRLRIPPSHHLAALSHNELSRALSEQAHRDSLKEHDQLYIERDVNQRVFAGLREGEFWSFKCSYKYKLGEIDTFDPKRWPAWTDRIMYATYTDSPDQPHQSHIINLLYTSVPSYTTSDHKPIVALLQLPPTISVSTDTTTLPVLRLPPTYRPIPDRRANLKRWTGRILGRVIGYCWCLLVFLGAGSTILGIGNFFISLGVWRWWRSRTASPTQSV